MSIRKRNEFLDRDESDEGSDGGYDSEAVKESKGALTGRASKRRRFEDASDEDVSDDDSIQEDQQDARFSKAKFSGLVEDDDAGGNPAELEDDIEDSHAKPSKNPSAPTSVTAAHKAAKKSGVLYISRVPPFMKPLTLRHHLLPHAPSGLGRIFLTPEAHASHSRRVKSGGNKKKSFTDGWVEFASKREAKVAAELLNGQTMGGKKGGFYYDDMWCVRYLKGFKWGHLTEQMRNEDAERRERLDMEVRRTKEENRRFVEGVERAKMLAGMEGKKRRRGEGMDGGEDHGEGSANGRRKAEFKQRKVQSQQDESEKKATEFLQRAGRKIF